MCVSYLMQCYTFSNPTFQTFSAVSIEMPPLAFMTIPPDSHGRSRLTLMKRKHFDPQTNDSHMDAALRDSGLNVQGVNKSPLLSLCHFPVLKAHITPIPFPLPMSYFLDILPPVSSAY